jgi:plasmid stabilization system protein ParE
MKVISSKYAKLELDDATHYYELEYPGLGGRFREEIRKAARRISEYPEARTVERGDVRKCILHTFPYKLLYSIEDLGIHLTQPATTGSVWANARRLSQNHFGS